MVQVTSKGLSRANEIYLNTDQRVRELKAEGRTIMGYLCIYPVQEILTALDIIPFRIFGDMKETITDADSWMGTAVCPFLRSCLDLGLKGKFDFVDGVIFAHICDVGCALGNTWRLAVEMPFSFFLDTPSTLGKPAQVRMKTLLQEYQESLEKYTGKKVTPEKLKDAIRLHNKQRALVRDLYELKKPDPPLISGVETVKVLKSVMSIPIEEGNQLLSEVIEECKNRKEGGPVKKSARLLMWGPVIDDVAFVDMLEGLDANLVMDDTCVGGRPFFDDVEITDDPLEGLAYHYLVDLKCPRSFREETFAPTTKNEADDLEYRYSYIKQYIKDWNINGVICESVRYCDSHGYEVRGLQDYLDSFGVANIYLEHDYSEAALGPLRTRAQGLVEVISSQI